jgi:hypothetical protein
MFTATLLDHNETVFTRLAAVGGTLVDAHSNKLSAERFAHFDVSLLNGIVG